MAEIIAVATQKGGVGKSTTSMNVAGGLIEQGNKVLLIDADAQADSTSVLLEGHQDLPPSQTLRATILKRKPLPLHQTKIDRLWIVPSTILLSNTDLKLASAMDRREYRLKTQLDRIKNNFDYVIIDCPPHLGFLTLNALCAADKVIIVVEPGQLEIKSIHQFEKTFEYVVSTANPTLVLKGILFNKRERTSASDISLETLLSEYPNHLLKTHIWRRTEIKDAQIEHQNIFTYKPQSVSAQAYRKLISEITAND